jgi:hypothetical protein
MKIYNYLFYKSFILAKKSKNFDDVPVLGGMIWTALCFIFNLMSIFFLIEGFGINTGIGSVLEHKYIMGLATLGLLLFYYSYKGRYKKIVKCYEEKEKHSVSIHPIIVIIFYYVGSFGLLLLAGLFKNKDWIFAQ